jgi:PAS domain S-box-containing protein
MRYLVDPVLGPFQPFAFFYLSAVFTARFAGVRAGAVALVLGILLGTFMFVEPRFSFILNRAAVFQMVTYSIVGSLILSLQYHATRAERVRQQFERRLHASERQFNDAFAHAPVGMALTDLEGHLLYVNREYCEITGYTQEELLGPGFNFKTLTYAEDLKRNLDVHRRLINEEIPAFYLEKRYVRKDGSLVWVRASASLRRDEDGKPFQIIGIVDNITDRRRAEAALRESEELFRAVADNIPQLAWMTDAAGEMLWFNKRWSDYTGLETESMRVDGWAAVHHPEHRERVREGWLRALANGISWEDTFPLRGRDGEYRWFLSRAFPIRDSNGKITRWFGTNTDITRLRETEQALKHAHEELERRAQDLEKTVAERTLSLQATVHELEAFSYSLSHDMRAPLRAMKGFSEILQDEYAERLGEQGRGYLKRISAAAGRLDQLIQDVLSYSRITRENIVLVPTDVEAIVRQLIDENPILHPPKAEVAVVTPMRCVLAHEAYLMQVLSNLVYNAVKFVSPGTLPRVKLWTEDRGDRVRLYVQDNGIGIPEEAHARIFGMFERFHDARQFEGTGIGLTIVKKAMERMGGSVGLSSEVGRGSTFWIELAAA